MKWKVGYICTHIRGIWPAIGIPPVYDYHFFFLPFSLAAEQLGLPLIPAYSEASGDQVLNGVNYASAAAGILDITGRNFVSMSTHTCRLK
jgi:hypothetical protein